MNQVDLVPIENGRNSPIIVVKTSNLGGTTPVSEKERS